MEPGERAFAILLDLGMIEEHRDPDLPSYDSAFDNDPVPGMIIERRNVDESVAVKSSETEGKKAAQTAINCIMQKMSSRNLAQREY